MGRLRCIFAALSIDNAAMTGSRPAREDSLALVESSGPGPQALTSEVESAAAATVHFTAAMEGASAARSCVTAAVELASGSMLPTPLQPLSRRERGFQQLGSHP